MSTAEIYNFEVTQNKFNSVVLTNSHQIPVLGLFMSPGIGTCIEFEMLLSKFATRFAGEFLLARIDIDMERELCEQYKIKNVPTLKIFKDGEAIYQEEGLMHEEEVAALLKSYGIYKHSDELRAQAKQLQESGDYGQAIQALTQAIQLDAGNPKIAIDMVQLLLDINELDEAKSLFNRLPDSEKSSDLGTALIGQMTFKDLAAKTPGLVNLAQIIEAEPTNLDAKLFAGICYAADKQFAESKQVIFEVMQQEPGFKDGAAKEVVLNIIKLQEFLEPEETIKTRKQLNNYLTA